MKIKYTGNIPDSDLVLSLLDDLIKNKIIKDSETQILGVSDDSITLDDVDNNPALKKVLSHYKEFKVFTEEVKVTEDSKDLETNKSAEPDVQVDSNINKIITPMSKKFNEELVKDEEKVDVTPVEDQKTKETKETEETELDKEEEEEENDSKEDESFSELEDENQSDDEHKVYSSNEKDTRTFAEKRKSYRSRKNYGKLKMYSDSELSDDEKQEITDTIVSILEDNKDITEEVLKEVKPTTKDEESEVEDNDDEEVKEESSVDTFSVSPYNIKKLHDLMKELSSEGVDYDVKSLMDKTDCSEEECDFAIKSFSASQVDEPSIDDLEDSEEELNRDMDTYASLLFKDIEELEDELQETEGDVLEDDVTTQEEVLDKEEDLVENDEPVVGKFFSKCFSKDSVANFKVAMINKMRK